MDVHANRVEIAQAIEKISAFKWPRHHGPCQGQNQQQGRILGETQGLEEAIVTLMPGERMISLKVYRGTPECTMAVVKKLNRPARVDVPEFSGFEEVTKTTPEEPAQNS